jgi:hypothetical protein
MKECLICLDEIKEDSDPLGQAWLSCPCKIDYHATCIFRWLYVEDIASIGKLIHKGCPVCKELDDLYIVDFIPPKESSAEPPPPPPPKAPSPPVPPPPQRRKSFMTRFRDLIDIFH